jgi:hypothetical protein
MRSLWGTRPRRRLRTRGWPEFAPGGRWLRLRRTRRAAAVVATALVAAAAAAAVVVVVVVMALVAVVGAGVELEVKMARRAGGGEE